MDIFSAPKFSNDEEARVYFETVLWPNGPVCPHCQSAKAYGTKRPGLYRCAEKACRKDFTVTKSTVLERSHIALHKWAQAFHLMASSKKGVSAHQLHRTLDIGYEAAWFMAHRIREAMRAKGIEPMGGDGTPVEGDETYFGKASGPAPKFNTRGKPFTKKGKGGPSGKRAIVALVERGGKARTFHVAVADKHSVQSIVVQNVAREAKLFTDESRLYGDVTKHVAGHETVHHSSREYVRGEVHVNSAEGYFSIFKRGMKGIYQHCAEKHLHRYLAEYDFRYNHRVKLGYNDVDRTAAAVAGAANKRLTYHQPL